MSEPSETSTDTYRPLADESDYELLLELKKRGLLQQAWASHKVDKFRLEMARDTRGFTGYIKEDLTRSLI